MSIETRFNALSRTQRVLLWFVFLTFLFGAVFALGEIIMRAKGRTPWKARVAIGMKIEPGGKLFRRDPAVGFVHVAGPITMQFPNGYTVRATHDANGRRITAPAGTVRPASADSIWIFGCSFTYGMGLNDEDTFPWVLQERFPDYRVVNFGQCGYGTLQPLLQLRQALETESPPRVAVLTYGEFHDERNTLRGRWRKGFFYYNTLGPLQQPYARLDRNGQITVGMSSAEYKGLPFMKQSALIHTLEEKHDILSDQYIIRSHEVSKGLIAEFARECEAHGIALIVAGIYIHNGTSDVLAFCREKGLSTVDIGVDIFSDPAYSLMPNDDHPNGRANKVYADGLEPVIRTALAQQ